VKKTDTVFASLPYGSVRHRATNYE